jgi:hypothetical protein
MDRKQPEQFRKERRNKSEQFRKSRNNFFHRGYEICVKSEAKILVLIERKGKYYRLSTSESLLHLSEAEIVSRACLPSTLTLIWLKVANLAMSKTADDFNKEVVRKRKKTAAPRISNPKPALVTRRITMQPTRPLHVNSRERRGEEPALVTRGIAMPPTRLLHVNSRERRGESSGNPDLPSFATLLEQIRSLGRRK